MTKNSLRILVADDEPLLVEELSAYLRDMGHEVVATASSGKELARLADQFLPDLIVTDIKMPELDGLEAAQSIFKNTAVPIIVVSAYHEEDLIERASQSGIMGYLVKPIDPASLKASITLATRRFKEFEALHEEYSSLRRTLADRKTIERAKGVLMKHNDLDEEQAFLHLQKLARDSSLRMAEVAQGILDA